MSRSTRSAQVAAIEVEDGRATGVRMGDGSVIAADAVLLGVGAAPNVDLAQSAGLDVDNGVLVDASLRSSNPDVYVVGDIANHDHPDHPELDDFGDAHVALSSGATGFVRVDWFTPSGLRTWGDGRTFVVGTEGYLELRKYVDVTTDNGPNQVILVDAEGEHRLEADGKVGYPFFGELVLDVLHRTENAMTQEHAFKAVELALKAQEAAKELTGR